MARTTLRFDDPDKGFDGPTEFAYDL
jgi:hypothetical protein